jgi:hypothetical protein
LNKYQVKPGIFKDLYIFLYLSKKRNREKEKGLGMIPELTLFLFKKVGLNQYPKCHGSQYILDYFRQM